MFEPISDNHSVIKNGFDDIVDQTKNSIMEITGKTALNMTSETLSYGTEMLKNAATYTAKKVYEIEWKENFKHLSEEVSTNIFPRPKDPRLSFLEAHPNFEDRFKISSELTKKYKSHIPIILERDKYSHLMPFRKNKLIVPKIFGTDDLIYTIRNYIPRLNSYEGVIMMLIQYNKDAVAIKSKMLLPNSYKVEELFNENRSEDNFLYIRIKEENIFG